MKNEHDAMDAMAEMTVALYEKMNQLKKEEAFYSWSKTILVNECKALLRKRQKVILLDEITAPVEGHHHLVINDTYTNADKQMDMQTLLANLKPPQLEAIQLKYFHDLDYETIAAITNVSVGTVKSRVHYGLKILREQYGGDDGGY